MPHADRATPPASAPQSGSPAHLPRPALVYAILAAASTMCLVVGDVIGSKLFEFNAWLPLVGDFKVHHTAGMLTFPITFLITDWLNDYYGKAAARRVVLISFAMGLLAFIAIQAARALPHWDVPFNVPKEAVEAIFGSASVMFVASLCAYLVGAFCDIFIFAKAKNLTGNRFIWLRATGSTVISQLIDSFVVTALAFSIGRHLFGGGVPMNASQVIETALTGYTLKFIIALAITPLLYLGHGIIHRSTGLSPLPPDKQ
jgi:queuosine precursor transporter